MRLFLAVTWIGFILVCVFMCHSTIFQSCWDGSSGVESVLKAADVFLMDTTQWLNWLWVSNQHTFDPQSSALPTEPLVCDCGVSLYVTSSYFLDDTMVTWFPRFFQKVNLTKNSEAQNTFNIACQGHEVHFILYVYRSELSTLGLWMHRFDYNYSSWLVLQIQGLWVWSQFGPILLWRLIMK